MSNALPRSPEEIAESFLELKNKIDTLLDICPKNDGRFIILTNCSFALLSIITRMNTWTALSNNFSLQNAFKKITGFREGSLEDFLRQDIFFVRLGFTAIFQFQIETLFKILLQRLENKKPPEKYSQIVKRLLKVLDLDSEEKEEIL